VYCGLAQGRAVGQGTDDTSETYPPILKGNVTQHVVAVLFYFSEVMPKKEESLLRLLKSGNYSNFEISTVNGEKFLLHRPVLAVRCPRLLEVDKVEVEGEVFRVFCEFIYGNVFPKDATSKVTGPLFRLAVKFQVMVLAQVCRKHIISSFSAGNVFDLLADFATFDSEDMITCAQWFIGKNKICPAPENSSKISPYPEIISQLISQAYNFTLEAPVVVVPQCEPVSTALLRLLQSQIESDFVIDVGGKSIPVHKCILGQEWEYFANILLKQNEKAQHDTEMPFHTFQKMVEYFYTGNTKTLTLTDSGWILSFSDFYLLPQNLTKFCDITLNSGINARNWQEAFVLGLSLKNKKLKKKALEAGSVDESFVKFFMEVVERQQLHIDKLKEENEKLRGQLVSPNEERCRPNI